MAVAPSGYSVSVNAQRDASCNRNWFFRWVVAGASFVLAFYAPINLVQMLLFKLNPELVELGFWIGLLMGGIIVDRIMDFFIVYNEEWTAYLTQNPITGQNIAYGPGIHISYPWELRNKTGNYPLTVITQQFTIDVPTQTSNLTFGGEIGWAVDLSRLNKFVGVGPEVVTSAFIGFIKGFVTSKAGGMKAEEAVPNLSTINSEMNAEFKAADSDTTPEGQFGVKTAFLNITSVDYPAAVKKARDGVAEGAQNNNVVAATLGLTPAELRAKMDNGDITVDQFKAFHDRAMATTENATMTLDVKEIKGVPEALQSLAAAIGLAMSSFTNRNQPPN
jgi:hypothetical protein